MPADFGTASIDSKAVRACTDICARDCSMY
jgi:hypothetical protein